ncbi:MAG: VOC family protein [Paracoccus sp. (in: a-proteobacteria)]|uniref:VOC family protein n=1 Tax=Paracoccus sp. TaxID=267 RepID=UPI0026E0FA32|nr:VOC family protein [Paracoccus sp. (in: a-proteobacteria)]MDO5631323.1 VOC family protein [Paracoccus sp. (in: a-proteobacteria)]
MRRMDHIVIGCENLDHGAALMERILGRPMDAGGRHPLMGTHNRLLHLGGMEYLELISVDPTAPRPGRTRWYGLDHFKGPPRILGWIARDEHFVAPRDSTIIEMSRGSLNWQFTMPINGQMPGHGTQPLLIRWSKGAHPCNMLPDHGFRLLRLQMTTPEPQPLARISDPRISLGFGQTELRILLQRPDQSQVWL